MLSYAEESTKYTWSLSSQMLWEDEISTSRRFIVDQTDRQDMKLCESIYHPEISIIATYGLYNNRHNPTNINHSYFSKQSSSTNDVYQYADNSNKTRLSREWTSRAMTRTRQPHKIGLHIRNKRENTIYIIPPKS